MWPFNAGYRLIQVTIWPGFTVYERNTDHLTPIPSELSNVVLNVYITNHMYCMCIAHRRQAYN